MPRKKRSLASALLIPHAKESASAHKLEAIASPKVPESDKKQAHGKRNHPKQDSLQSLFFGSGTSGMAGRLTQVAVNVEKVTPEDKMLTFQPDYMEDDNQELFKQLVSFCSQWMPAPMPLQFRLDREMSSLTLSSVMIQKTPIHVLKAKPITNLDLQLHARLEFASIYAISLYDYFNAAELSLRLESADYLSERNRHRKPSPGAPQSVQKMGLEQAKSKRSKTSGRASATAKEKIHEIVIPLPPQLPSSVICTSSPANLACPKISSNHRSLIVELLVTFACQDFTSPPETLHIAVNIMDRFLAARHSEGFVGLGAHAGPVDTKGFALNFTSGVRHTPLEAANLLYVAMASLSLAWKYEEKFRADVMDTAVPAIVGWQKILKAKKGTAVNDLQNHMAYAAKGNNVTTSNKRPREPSPPSPSEFSSQVPLLPTPMFSNPLRSRPVGLAAESLEPTRKHVLAEIISLELEILETLHWQVRVPTAQTFLKRYMLAGQLSMRQCLIATCLCERTLLDYSLLQYLPSLIAASIVSLVRILFRLDGWSSTLEHYTGMYVLDMIFLRELEYVVNFYNANSFFLCTYIHLRTSAHTTGYQQSALDECILSIQRALLAEELGLFRAAEAQGEPSSSSISSHSSEQLFLTEPSRLGKRKAKPESSTIAAGAVAGQQYIPGSSIRAKYKDDIYRSLINLPVKWTKSSSSDKSSLSMSSSAASYTSSVTPLSSMSSRSSRLSAGL